jgi:large subunit ribosomal protein L29
MKPAEIRALNAEQREERLQELHAEWRDLRFQEAVGQLTATARTRQIRKDIARIHTINGETERAGATTATS